MKTIIPILLIIVLCSCNPKIYTVDCAERMIREPITIKFDSWKKFINQTERLHDNHVIYGTYYEKGKYVIEIDCDDVDKKGTKIFRKRVIKRSNYKRISQ